MASRIAARTWLWSSASSTATDVVTSTRYAEAGTPDTSTRPRAMAAISRRMGTSVPGEELAQEEPDADGDGDGLEWVASHVAASVATPCLHRLSGQSLHVRIHIAGVLAGPVRHLLRPRLRVGPCSRRRVLGLSGQASRVPLRRIAHALEPPIVHDFLLVTLTLSNVRLLCHWARTPQSSALEQCVQGLRVMKERRQRIAHVGESLARVPQMELLWIERALQLGPLDGRGHRSTGVL